MDSKIQFRDNFSQIIYDADSYGLHPLELKSIDRTVKDVIYAKAKAQDIFPTQNIARGRTDFRFYKATEPHDPILSQDFLPEAMENVDKTEFNIELIGASLDYFISMRDLDASRNSNYVNTSIDTLHVREISAKIADVKEQILWRGEDIDNGDPSAIAGGLTGIMNDANIQSPASVGLNDDDDITAPGDGPDAIGKMADKLLNQYFEPPYTLAMTPSVYGCLLQNINDTTNLTDIERIKAMTGKDDTGLLGKIIVTPHLTTGSNEKICLIAPKSPTGGPTTKIIQSYPLWHYPIQTTTLGIQGKVLWMGGTAVIRPNGICASAALTVS